MATAAPKAPATFGVAQKQRAIEAQASMTKALKEHRFEEALEHAKTALSLDPNNVMLKDFVRLLEEKQDLDATDDDEEEGAPAGAAGTAAAADAQESEESEEEDEEDEGEEEDEDEEDEDEEEEEEEELEPEVLAALQRLRLGAAGGKAAAGKAAAVKAPAAAGPAPAGLGAAQRKAMRAGLAASIKELKEVEQMKKLVADDPLLGA